MTQTLTAHASIRAVLPVALLLLTTAPAQSDNRDADAIEFNRDVRPILAENCFACHGADSASRKADLRIDQRAAAIDFGAIAPGEPDDSELMLRLVTDDPDLVMPPPETKKKLTKTEIETLRRWIAEGAEYQPHWSFIAPRSAAPPTVQNEAWIKDPIDRFVLARLESAGLTPAPEADPQTFFRRLHLDITGLPPQPEDMDSFVQEYSTAGDDAVRTWVDRLINSTAWGEHRGRYWLDAARYADTHGMHFDNYREMWPYRDWVIRAFNENQPFDEFIVDQLAGDLLPSPTQDQLIATGFQRCNMTTNEGGTIDEENLANYAVDRVQTFGWVYLGLTTNCAQCHDHKFDPITMRDFYSLAAFFRNTTQGPKDGNRKDGLGPVLVVPGENDRPRYEELKTLVAEAMSERDQYKAKLETRSQGWFDTQTAETLASALPAEDLILHAPLDEGTDHAIRLLSDPDYQDEPQTVSASGPIEWAGDGKLGPAPIIRRGSTFDLGKVGDFQQGDSFSFGAWVKPGSDNRVAAVIARMDESANYRGWDLFQNGKSYAVHLIDAWPGNAIKVTTKDPVIRPGQWQHVFVTYNGSGRASGIRIYVDGQLRPVNVDNNSLTVDATIRTETPLRIGQRSKGSVFADSGIQDLRMYARKLDTIEVRKLAKFAELRAVLGVPSDQRTAEQNKTIFNYYLATQDKPFVALDRKVKKLQREQKAIEDRSAITHIQKEKMDSPAMAHMLIRGEYDQKGEQVAAAPPAALHPLPEGQPRNRLGLARWVVDPANPLTARVTVNRFWQEIFGAGLVGTSEDFGVMGELPSHPDLLDYLAIEFQSSDWDVKNLFQQIFTSATYRQATKITPEKLERDRDNRLLSRGPRFRMDAEMVRDYALAASGLLSRKMYGPGVKPYQPEAIWSIVGLPGGDTRDYQRSEGQDLYRRSIYSFWKRMAPPPSLEAFNAPSREVCTVRRERTNTPLQALVTLNDPQFVEAARHLASQALLASHGDENRTIDFISRRVLGRVFSDRERSIVRADQHAFADYYSANVDAAESLVRVGESVIDPQTDVATLATWTMVCNQLMNLDEALNQ